MKYKPLTVEQERARLNSWTIWTAELYKSSKCQFKEIQLW